MKFSDIKPGHDNINVTVKIRFKSDILTSKKGKKYFFITGFDGNDIARISLFDEKLAEMFEEGSVYNITGISAKAGKYSAVDLTFSKGEITKEKNDPFDNKYGNITNLNDISKEEEVNVAGVCMEIHPIKEIRTNDGRNTTLRIIKLRDKTASIYIKSWENHFKIKEGDGVLIEKLKVKSFGSTVELIANINTTVTLDAEPSKNIKTWITTEGKTTSTINLSMPTEFQTIIDQKVTASNDATATHENIKTNNKRRHSTDSDDSDSDTNKKLKKKNKKKYKFKSDDSDSDIQEYIRVIKKLKKRVKRHSTKIKRKTDSSSESD